MNGINYCKKKNSTWIKLILSNNMQFCWLVWTRIISTVMAQNSKFWGELCEGTSQKLHMKIQTRQGFTQTNSAINVLYCTNVLVTSSIKCQLVKWTYQLKSFMHGVANVSFGLSWIMFWGRHSIVLMIVIRKIEDIVC